MKTLTTTLTALFLLSAPALAGGVAVDLPYLTFPDDAVGTPTRGCETPNTPTPATGCVKSN